MLAIRPPGAMHAAIFWGLFWKVSISGMGSIFISSGVYHFILNLGQFIDLKTGRNKIY
jgi:hypothetical protein